ncbi:enolase C-terminal domain-like protein [Chelativorans sp. AA-79]|uniref:enolase C-terminal domain-like protein n=1 Tax=Chelativorans sp. AA-79 TaxID=3028735 RepID=UPI0023F6EFA2|nr:enolase C-terminal domain-like protein [Chelativorans sp. AA-79]WEX11093.1 enolase C-terminal domain-like protein [Chelativorans sp. AA-79]
MATIRSFDFRVFSYVLEGLSVDESQNTVYTPGSSVTRKGLAIVVTDSDGNRGEFVNLDSDSAMTAQSIAIANMLVGRDVDARELMYDDAKRVHRKQGAFGYSNLDIAIWDLAGKRANLPIYKLLGGFRKSLPAYVSTFHGDRNGGLSTKEAFADYAEACLEQGFKAFKIHGWSAGDRREEAANVLHVAARVGGRMDLMLDPACELRTFGDALYVGRACDEAKFFWYEDPFRDGGFSRHAHRKLRQMLKTPILMGEHIRGLEAKADAITAEATDYVRVNPTLDMGVTGAMKIAHLAEAHGLDVEFHGCGPSQRQVMAAVRNANYYELTLCAPGIGNPKPPIYACGYSDSPEHVDADGNVPMPDLPGIGVGYHWDFIIRSTTEQVTVGR